MRRRLRLEGRRHGLDQSIFTGPRKDWRDRGQRPIDGLRRRAGATSILLG
jgi:hypothetical protein